MIIENVLCQDDDDHYNKKEHFHFPLQFELQ